jgi:transcriptional regulator with XRE-family HTH domain
MNPPPRYLLTSLVEPDPLQPPEQAMTAWSDYSTGERIKILRGSELTQNDLAEAAGVSVALVQKVEQGRTVTVASLIKLADALGTDVSVLLGQQAPRRAMSRAERTAVRNLSHAVHDSVLTSPADLDPPPLADLKATLATTWERFWRGDYTSTCATTPHLIAEAGVHSRAQRTTPRAGAGSTSRRLPGGRVGREPTRPARSRIRGTLARS